MKINSVEFWSVFTVQNCSISTKVHFLLRKTAWSKPFQQALFICMGTKRQIYICQNWRALQVVTYRELQNIVGFGWVLVYSLTSYQGWLMTLKSDSGACSCSHDTGPVFCRAYWLLHTRWCLTSGFRWVLWWTCLFLRSISIFYAGLLSVQSM